MSDKIYRTVTFEIEPSGDCGKCPSRHANTCWCFGDSVYSLIQLPPCKEFLLEQGYNKCKYYISKDIAVTGCEFTARKSEAALFKFCPFCGKEVAICED